jgi:large subunit ribosomal protein L1
VTAWFYRPAQAKPSAWPYWPAVKEAKAGKVEYRVDQAGIVHLAIGKVSFGAQKISQNAQAAIASIKAAKPASLKGIYIKSAYLTTTMGPSVKVDIS